MDNEEIRTIISVIGTGTRHAFDIERLKFHKVILLADADVDGSHIICLLLTLFHQEMPGLIENGNIYLGCPPLYSVKYKGKTRLAHRRRGAQAVPRSSTRTPRAWSSSATRAWAR